MAQFDDSTKKLSELRRSEEEELMKTLSLRYGHQYINLYGITINTEALHIVSEAVSRSAELAVFARAGVKLSIALHNPNKKEAADLLESLRGRNFMVTTYMASHASLEHAWERYKDMVQTSASEKGVLGITASDIKKMAETIKKTGDVAERITTLRTGSDSGNVSAILSLLLGGAVALHASDVHIEPDEATARVRFRLDGVLWDAAEIDRHMCDLVRARLKLLSGLKLNITDRAQDGRFTIDVGEKEFEIRTSIIPGAYGESIVMRFLDPESINVTIEQLGINAHLLSVIYEELKRPNGMIITTGPTGSGKTTALYTFLRMAHNTEVKIITIEDPIEYHLPGIVQTQTADKYSFASGLRAILRQDPDIIMVGEIRDSEVAETAMNAALTGHLVFSTLHTNSAAGAFPRLRDLGVDPRTMGSALNLVMAQRLVRILCTTCRKERALTESERTRFATLLTTYPEHINVADAHVYDAVGCDACSGSGYKGRMGVFEGIRITPAVAEAVAADMREKTIMDAALPQHIPTMQQDGIVKALTGITSIDELERVIDLYKDDGATPPPATIQE